MNWSKIKEGAEPDGDGSDIGQRIMEYLAKMKEKYAAKTEKKAEEIEKKGRLFLRYRRER